MVDNKDTLKKEYNKKWHEENAERVRERVKKWQKDNREKANANKRRSYHKDPLKTKSRKLKNRYGITLEDFEKLCELQKHKCAICGQTSKLVPDHDHSNGKMRESLCYKCNIILGQAGDNINILEIAINYLTKHKQIHET